MAPGLLTLTLASGPAPLPLLLVPRGLPSLPLEPLMDPMTARDRAVLGRLLSESLGEAWTVRSLPEDHVLGCAVYARHNDRALHVYPDRSWRLLEAGEEIGAGGPRVDRHWREKLVREVRQALALHELLAAGDAA